MKMLCKIISSIREITTKITFTFAFKAIAFVRVTIMNITGM